MKIREGHGRGREGKRREERLGGNKEVGKVTLLWSKTALSTGAVERDSLMLMEHLGAQRCRGADLSRRREPGR